MIKKLYKMVWQGDTDAANGRYMIGCTVVFTSGRCSAYWVDVAGHALHGADPAERRQNLATLVGLLTAEIDKRFGVQELPEGVECDPRFARARV